MSHQPRLLDVERVPSRKDRLHAFMKKHDIESHAMPGSETYKWVVVAMRSARQYGYGVTPASSLVDVFAKVGRLLDESGCAQYGRTEEEAVRSLCEDYLKIPFNP